MEIILSPQIATWWRLLWRGTLSLPISGLDEPQNVGGLGREDSGPARNSLQVASSSQEKRACLLQVYLCLPEVHVSYRQMEVSLSVTLLEVVASSFRN